MKHDPLPLKDVLLFNDLIMVRKLVSSWPWQPFARLAPDDEWEMVVGSAPLPDGGFVRAADAALVYVHQQCQRQN